MIGRMWQRLAIGLVIVALPHAYVACGSVSPESPTAPTPVAAAPVPPAPEAPPKWPAGPTPETAFIEFTGAGPDGAAITTHNEAGYTLVLTQGSWTVAATKGNAPPSIQFVSAAGTSSTGEITLSGAPFKFSYLDFSSSTTPLPFTITGTLRGRPLFTISSTLTTQGAFRRVFNSSPDGNVVIDGLVIRLTNDAAACCVNPVAIDNIVLRV